jgi:crotonobetainyl-CoA:carnitine CoA-transferase CaiB-like acyl-CoA transferase
MFLGDLGADVIKVEALTGDIGRTIGPPWDGDDAAVYTAFNRNKRSICMDLKQSEGRELARRLIGKSDVIVESFRPGVMQRFELDYENVSSFNPSIVYCSVSAYGQTGPYSGKAGVDGILQAASGLMSLIGEAGGDPCKVQTPAVDVTTGYTATIAVLAALMDRVTTGKGTHLDASLFATAVALQQCSVTGYLADGELPIKIGSAAPYSAPNEAFPTRDGHVMIAAYMPERWKALCSVLKTPQLLVDERFITSQQRVLNRPALRIILSEIFRQGDTDAWISLLEAADIPCSPVATYDRLMHHPQLLHQNLIVRAEGASGKTFQFPAFPVRDNGAPLQYLPPPVLGEHTRSVLEQLHYSAEDIAHLVSCRVVNAG